ncbi:5'-3' exoribonuclease 2 [Ophidiomyces ophidiicola]|uniref:5'-3' exoribonuclease 2 n=1 Tax=Ophidiomyces ophidiicola TaxID=1387563 RepID=A0ACB8UUJ0_9EURO|nr:5'-3' exoribonuclease 2 [Ophidiomyces ophidiicola]KAI1944348.1 5'-3' exoribonuclease 2 [Ophidiomyces ophidiicola]KAI1973394.1 5'-3' exoribonuclease 2 [Ophidiomyces ophidiicola]KAI2004512.1 5'-3' exoribonuclease 2 [Ophidiomyces ophidiicola]KAI2019638.1 5'-3' exoribonuclease 2 [Ophidiomyces ophidiicola]
MGVPALFRWLSTKYPKIISAVVEELPQEYNGEEIPVDTTKPNPNGEEMDNLYLDMNGIVHPCTHPEGKPPPANEGEMMLEIFKYTDRVVNMVRPRKLLMIAVDGVAPRAKMNQQRSRRFRSAQEAKEADEKKAEFAKLLQRQNRGKGDSELGEEVIQKTWDSNVITPGTPFMDILSAALRYWIAYKLNTDPAWDKLKIIVSDATVPGEGEHKIMEFIRSQRSCPEHNANTRHVIYGLDADLIMLGLATHEPHFRVLREDVFFQESKARTCHLCGQKGHIAEACTGKAKEKTGDFDEKENASPLKPFIWLHVSVLREYLAAEMYVPNQPFAFDLERALDDWVFMCFFVGNDFLPHLPSLDIRENGIDTLIAIWRDNIPLMGGYLTKDGHVDLKRAQLILQGLAKQEDAIFRRRRQTEERKNANARRRKEQERQRENNSRKRPRNSMENDTPIPGARRNKDGDSSAPANMPLFIPSKGELPRAERELTHSMVVNRGAIYKANMANKSAAAALKSQLLSGSSNDGESTQITAETTVEVSMTDQNLNSTLGKRKVDALDTENSTGQEGSEKPNDEDQLPVDTVRLWEQGYADRYYEQKFRVDPKDIEFRHKVAQAYVEGLSWVLLYYFQGCPSWTWYYPYHYAPFAADFVDLDQMDIQFNKGIPFRPFEQLMGVLPAASNHAIPEIFRDLMSDPDSEIIDFYPEEFPIDLNGKKFAWQGVALLPFIDEKRLLAAMNKRYPHLSEEERARNEMGRDILFISDRHPLYDDLVSNFYSKKQGVPKFKLNMRVSEGLGGKVERNEAYVPHSSLIPAIDGAELPSLDQDHSISVLYDIPKSKHIHKSMLLSGVKFNPPVLDKADIEATKAKASQSGRSFGGAPLHSGNGRGRGRMSYTGDRQNPFAAHLDPNFRPPSNMNPSQRGWNPPPRGGGQPPQFDRYQGRGGYGGGRGRGSYGPRDSYQPPPSYGRDSYQDRQYPSSGGGGRPGSGGGGGHHRGRGRGQQSGHRARNDGYGRY